MLASQLGSQHPSTNVNTLCNFEPQRWPEIITSRDAESTRFKGSRTSCNVIMFAFFRTNFRSRPGKPAKERAKTKRFFVNSGVFP